MNVRASALNAGIAGVMAEGYPLGLLEGEEASQAVSLERQTALPQRRPAWLVCWP